MVEYLDQILPGYDGEVRKEAAKIFKKQGFRTSAPAPRLPVRPSMAARRR